MADILVNALLCSNTLGASAIGSISKIRTLRLREFTKPGQASSKSKLPSQDLRILGFIAQTQKHFLNKILGRRPLHKTENIRTPWVETGIRTLEPCPLAPPHLPLWAL